MFSNSLSRFTFIISLTFNKLAEKLNQCYTEKTASGKTARFTRGKHCQTVFFITF